MREELRKAKTELRQIRMELTHSNAQKEKISSQVKLFTNTTFHLGTGVEKDHLRGLVVSIYVYLNTFVSCSSKDLRESLVRTLQN